MAGSPPNLPTEVIDEVILRLLALEPNEVDELDYETYRQYLKELLIEIDRGRKIGGDEAKSVRDEFKRVRSKKGRFKIKSKKTKVTANGLGIGNIRNQIKGAQQRIMLMPVGGIPKGSKDVKEKVERVSKKKVESDPLIRISKTLDSILKTLTDINKEDKKKSEKDRRDSENKKRRSRESGLESKPVSGLMTALKSALKPFQSIIDKIINFVVMTLLGRAMIKLIDWFADPKNAGKIQSIVRFFKDHWPTLLALYLRFGTGLGRFIGRLGGILIKGAFKLGALATKLLLKAGIGKAGGKLSKVAGFLGGPRGKAVATGLGIAADVAVTAGAAVGIEKLMGGGEQPTQKFSGGGSVRYPKFSGGGFNFKGMMGGAGMGAMFGPLGMLLGAGVGSGMFNGLIKGPGGPKGDKIHALLSNGEFVMSAGAVQKYGVDTFESMNAAGGGTNIPKIASGIVHAAGGGYVGDPVAAQEAWTNYMKMNPSKFARGADYGDFESVNRASRDFMKTFMRTGQPPEWARVSQRTTRVNTPPRSSQTPPPRSTPPNASSSSLMRRPTSALSTDVRSPGIRSVRPRGYGGALQAAFAAMEFNDRKQAGQTTAQAGLGAAGSSLGGSVGWMSGAKAGALLGGAIGAMFGGVGAGPGAAVGAIVGGLAGGFGGASLGGKLADDVSGVNVAKERMSRGGIGGGIKGGFGLKKESAKDQFKNAPKTMVMTDDKGRPFVGHKAMKKGQLTYVRPSKPGTGTTNPLEMLGRMINPGAYKDSDARLAMKNQKIAMVNALERFQAQGMAPDAQARMMKKMGGNLKDVQNDLKYRKNTQNLIKQGKLKPDGTQYTAREKMRMSISGSQTRKSPVKPKPKPKPKPYTPAGGGMGGGRGSGSNPSTKGTQPPRFSPTHGSGTRKAQAVYGVKK